jgi:hypothetical protein
LSRFARLPFAATVLCWVVTGCGRERPATKAELPRSPAISLPGEEKARVEQILKVMKRKGWLPPAKAKSKR